MEPIIQAFFDPATATVTYLLHDPASRQAAVIDPVLDYAPETAQVREDSARAVLAAATGLHVRYVLETHVHADHLSGAQVIQRETGARIVIGGRVSEVQRNFGPMFGMAPETSAFDMLVDDGATLPLGEHDIRVLATPGHTPACVSYLIGNCAFVGDTLFMPDYGTARADFPGGDARALYRSIRKILALPEATRIFVGHDYLPAGRAAFAWETSVAAQRRGNVHVRDGISEDAFVAMRQARDATLKPPALMLSALQVNIQAGRLPDKFVT